MTVKEVLIIPDLKTFLLELFRLRGNEFWIAIDAQRNDSSILSSKDRTSFDELMNREIPWTTSKS